MTRIIIRDLDKEMEQELRIRAAGNDHSIEEEVRGILRDALAEDPVPEKGLGTAIHRMFQTAGGIELDIPSRQSMREPPRFD